MIGGKHKENNKCMQNFSVIALKGGGHMGNPGIDGRITSDRAFDDEGNVELYSVQ
jgi:hypothetical protein